MKLTPKDFILQNTEIYTNKPNPIPKNPQVNPNKIKINLKYLK